MNKQEYEQEIAALTNAIGAIMSYLLLQEQSFKDDLLDGKITDETLKTWGVRAEVKDGHIQLLL
jgi:hypothetical protein